MKNLKLSTQLILGISSIILFVIALGWITGIQINRLYVHADTLFQNPLHITKAVNTIRIDILEINAALLNITDTTVDEDRHAKADAIYLSFAEVDNSFGVVKERYLGPTGDVTSAYANFLIWESAVEETLAHARIGDYDIVADRMSNSGIVTMNENKLTSTLDTIYTYANNKADTLNVGYVELYNSVNVQRVTLMTVIIVLLLLISVVLIKNIRRPLKELTGVTERFQTGDMNARSTYLYRNEFGILSKSFNAMVRTIQRNADLNNKVISLGSTMSSGTTAADFFTSVLTDLNEQTGAQGSAAYLISDDRKTYDILMSVGIDSTIQKSFDAESFEGVFGMAIASGKIQHITNIPEQSLIIIPTATVKLKPQEIITIPIYTGKILTTIITLISVSRFKPDAVLLLNRILETLSARIEGILTNRRLREIRDMLEQQNVELTAQKSEMSAQAAEMQMQNTELEMQKSQLAEASRLKTDFLSNMSHELRTPLNSVIALSGVLNRRLIGKIPDEEHGYLDVIERNGKNLLILINDILDISRIESGREEIDISQMSVNEVIGDIVGMIQPQAEEKGIHLFYNVSEPDVHIYSDETKCRHILQNIIGNAVKFTEKGQVEITARLEGTTVEITVKDTGIGIDKTNLPYVFDEFRQADSSMARKYGGTGLGLAIAQKYADMLGGEIDVTSTLGRGSTFILMLPVRSEVEQIAEGSEPPTESKHQRLTSLAGEAEARFCKTVLIIEDSEPAIIQLEDLLESSGYVALAACNAQEAFNIMSQIVPDAIILDLMMPDIDGFEVLRVLREAESTTMIPVLILTARHITKDELKFLNRNHIHQLIQKGDINRTQLLTAVSEMLCQNGAGGEVMSQEMRVPERQPVVLVVEDNSDNIITINALLEDTFTVHSAVSGLEAVEKAEISVPDLILMDISLPGIDGVEAFKRIRNNPALLHIPVIAVTAMAMAHDRETILAYGFDAYIAKPIIAKQLFKVISEVLYGQ